MPEILRFRNIVWFLKVGDYRIPLHVHVRMGSKQCKIMLPSLRVAKNSGFSKRELGLIVKLTERHKVMITEYIREMDDE